jgi:hypothetical protein
VTAVAANQAVVNLAAPQVRAAIARLCRENFLIFLKVELGMEIGPQHHIWWEHLTDKDRDVCEMAPRDHGKSHALARGYPLWKAKYDPWTRDILILGADQPSAVENLDKMKDLILRAPKLEYLFPKGRSADSINSRTEMLLTNGVRIRAKGYMSPLRGRHPQLIVLDDVLNEKNSSTEENREGTKKYFFEVLYPMKDKGLRKAREAGHQSKIAVIGTAQDTRDLYHHLQSNDGFIGSRLEAIIDWDEETVLWDERYTYQDLIKIKDRVGSLAFSKEYMNQPLDDETTIFPPGLFEPLKDPTISYEPNYVGHNAVFLGADFSVPGSLDGDWSVFYVVEFDDSSQMFRPLTYWRARPAKIQDQIRQLELMCQLYGVTVGCLEANLFQKIYAEHFKNTVLPLRANVVTHAGKNSYELGLLSFRPLFENGRWRFPYKTARDKSMTDHMITEFNGVKQRKGRIENTSFHDDTVMAMWHCLCASRASTFSAEWM